MADIKKIQVGGAEYALADAEARRALQMTARTVDSDGAADLDLVDGDGNVILRLENGQIETKAFRSAGAAGTVPTDGSADLDLADANGHVLVRFAGGHIRTRNFDSAHLDGWAGKKWAAIGDSLTEANIRTTLHYHDYIAELTGITVVNLGHSGAGYYARPSDYTFRTQVQNVPLDSDVVTIFGSGNDIGKKDLGEVTDTTQDTLCRYINDTLDNLYTRLPAVNLGVLPPTPWYGGSYDWTPENPGNPMELYCEAIVEICKRRSVPCLDLYHCSNLRPQNATARGLEYSKDDGNGVHPDETGHLLIAPRILAFLRGLLM